MWFISFPAPILSPYLRGEKVTIDTTSLLLSSNVFKKKSKGKDGNGNIIGEKLWIIDRPR